MIYLRVYTVHACYCCSCSHILQRFGCLCKIFRSTFAGWALTEGQHRPKAGKKKKTREAGLFFLVRKWVNPMFPDPVGGVYLSSIFSDQSYTWIGVDRQGLVFFRVRAGPNVSQRIYPVQVRHTLAWMFGDFCSNILGVMKR